MNKFISIAGAAALALVVSVSMATPSSADDAGSAIAGGVLGFMAGAAVAGSGPHYSHYDSYDDGSFAWRHHVRACFRAYGDDYDPQSDTFIGDDGYEHRCRF
ncbi:MAG: BA14K family protein [Devosia sp.]